MDIGMGRGRRRCVCNTLLAYIKLARLKRENIALLRSIDTGGHKRNRDQRYHAEHHRRLADDFLARPRLPKMGSCTKLFPPNFHRRRYRMGPVFHRRYRMGPSCFHACFAKSRTKILDALWETEGAGLDSA